MLPDNQPANTSVEDLQPATETAAKPNIESLKAAVQGLIKEHIQQDVDREKVYQYAQARKNELYWRGHQYVYPVLVDGVTADWTATGNLTASQTEDEREVSNDYVLNIIRGDGQKFVAVLGQRGPNVKASARREDDDLAVARARKADQAAAYLQSMWKSERIQRHLALSLWKNGTTFGYTPWVANGEKYGVVNEPEVEIVDAPIGPEFYHCMGCGQDTPKESATGLTPFATCVGCGRPLAAQDLQPPLQGQIPVQVGTKSYPKGTVELHLATIFEVTVPFYARDLADCPWLWYEYEEHKAKLLAAFPELREKLGANNEWGGDTNGLSAQGRLARDVASSPTGSYIAPRKNRWLYSRFWLRPAMYELINDQTKRQAFYSEFPTGCKVTMVNDTVVDLADERLDDVWSMCKPGTSEYIFADPVCKDYMQIQDIVNDMYNLVVETMERAIPFLLADPTVLDILQLTKRSGRPGEIVPTKPGVGARLDQSIAKSPVATPDGEVIKWIDMVHQKGRELVGILPAIFGGDAPSRTAREAELRRNQALQQLNPYWNEMRDFWAQVHTNGCKQLAKHSLEDGSNLGQFEGPEAAFGELAEGGYFFEAEESMPMTWGQKRDLVMYMLQLGPAAWQLFGLQHPLNVSIIQETLGMAGWHVPNLDARDKVMEQIKQLVQGEPLPGQPDPMTGQPGPPQPSIPPDSFEDDPMFVAQVIKEWAQTPEARAIRAKQPGGYANVMAFGQAYLALIPPPAAPPDKANGSVKSIPPPGSQDPEAEPEGLATPAANPGLPAMPGGQPTASPMQPASAN